MFLRSGGSGLPAGDEEIACIDLYGFAILIERRRPHPDQAAIGARFRWTHLEHFALHVQLIARTNRTRPAQFVETNSKNTVCRFELAFHDEAHGERRSMPAARGQPAKDRSVGGVLVKVVRLRIELHSEGYDLILVDTQTPRAKDLACGVIFKILLGHFLER